MVESVKCPIYDEQCEHEKVSLCLGFFKLDIKNMPRGNTTEQSLDVVRHTWEIMEYCFKRFHHASGVNPAWDPKSLEVMCEYEPIGKKKRPLPPQWVQDILNKKVDVFGMPIEEQQNKEDPFK